MIEPDIKATKPVKAGGAAFWITLLIAFIFLVSLGVWQLVRLQEKVRIIKAIESAQTESYRPFSAFKNDPEKLAWQRVILPECRPDPDHFVAVHGMQGAREGYRILTACPLDTSWIVVELGFSDSARISLPKHGFTPMGQIRLFEKPNLFVAPNAPQSGEWYWRDPKALSETFRHPLRQDIFMLADLKPSDLHIEGVLQEDLSPQLTNRHLEYALTWFALALSLLGVAGWWRFGPDRLRGS